MDEKWDKLFLCIAKCDVSSLALLSASAGLYPQGTINFFPKQVCSLKYLTTTLFISNRWCPLFVADVAENENKFLKHMLLQLGNVKCSLVPIFAGISMKHNLSFWC